MLVSLFFCTSGFAQIRISSPYSRYGLGELQTSHSVYLSSLGGINAAVRNPGFINVNNPASYTSFDTNSFVFDVGVLSKFTELKTNLSTQNYTNHTSIGHILFGFPITHWCGVSAGLIPYSKTGYKVSVSDTLHNNTDVRYNEYFTGSGGISQAFIGLAFRPFKNFSLGANFGYLFGTIYKDKTIEFPDDAYAFNVFATNDVQVGGIYMNYGLQYQIFMKKNYSLTLGTKFNLPMNLNAKQNLIVERYAGSIESAMSVKDTLINVSQGEGKIHLPLTVGGGFVFSKKNLWMVGGDFEWENWEKFTSFGLSDSTGNSYAIAVGGEYTPQFNDLSNYLKRINYRAGFHFSQSYYEIRNTKINDFGFSVGLGFPLKKTRTNINVALEAGAKGTINKNLLQENYFRIVLGISFREFWFFRPKLD